MKQSTVYILIGILAAALGTTLIAVGCHGAASAPDKETSAPPLITAAPEDTTVVTTTVTTTTTTEPTYTITMSFTGDMLIAGYKGSTSYGSVNGYAARHDPDYFLQNVSHIFQTDDFTMVDLENVLTDRVLTEVPRDYEPAFWFYGPSSNAEILSCAGVDGVSLENNHTYDYGAEGYADTIDAVQKVGLQYGDCYETFYFEKEGFTVAMICHGLWGEWQAGEIVRRVEEASVHSDYQVVYFHGGTEKIHQPEDWKIRACHQIVDGGADLVIGDHPHVLQPREVYNGVEIVYSLGNFCYGGNNYPENRTVIYQMTLTVDREKNVINEASTIIPCYVYTGDINNFQPAIIEDEETRQRVLDFMDWKLDSPL